MCMKPIHIFSNKNKNIYLPVTMLDTSSKRDLNSHSSSDLDQHLRFLPVEYDPSIDPDNMSQYTSKIYKVKEFYEKELIMDSSSNSTPNSDSQLDLPPPYIEQQKLKTKPSPPPYKQFEEDDKDDKEVANSSDNKKKRNWSAVGYCLIWLLILFFLQDGMSDSYMDCHGKDGHDKAGGMSDKHSKHHDRHNGHNGHNGHYNKATIVYSLTSDELKVDQVE